MVSHAINYNVNPHLKILEPLQTETKMVGGGVPILFFALPNSFELEIHSYHNIKTEAFFPYIFKCNVPSLFL